MYKAYKYRLYPNKEQSTKIDNTINACRFIYNLALETNMYAWKSARKRLSSFDLCYQLVDLKKDNEWLYEISSQSLQAAIRNMDKAVSNLFKGKGHPKFKKKDKCGSFQCPTGVRRIDWNKSTLTIPKIKHIPIVLSRKFDGEIKTITIRKTATGKYFASILVLNEKIKKQSVKCEKINAIGIDIGIKNYITTSDSVFVNPNNYFKVKEKKLKFLYRQAAKKKKGSNNKAKANNKISILYEKITNHRCDYIHKCTTQLIRDSQANSFAVEDLCITGMLKNKTLAKSIANASFGEFFRQMKYKCEWYNKKLIVIDRFYPSTKKCSNCGYINNELTLDDRTWQCTDCLHEHDRDVNAAINILNRSIEKSSGGRCLKPAESPSIEGAMKQEGFIHPKA